MNNRIIHFVFNEDIENDTLGSFNTSISNIGIPVWPVPYDISTFQTCLKALGSGFKVSIWVHIQANDQTEQKQKLNKLKGILFLSKKFYKAFGIDISMKVRFVTRLPVPEQEKFKSVLLDDQTISVPVFVDTAVDKECLKADWLVNVSDIKIKDDESDTEDDSILRIPSTSPFLIKFLQENKIDEVNKSLCSTKEFLLQISEQQDKLWHEALLRLIGFDMPNPFQNKYWEFNKDVFTNSFTLNSTDTNYVETISKNFSDIEEDVKLNAAKKQWEIKLNFFYAIFEREKNIKDGFDWANAPQEASALYVLHEALHQEHKLDYRTVSGIGNFPKTVEDADYQADAFAVIIEFCRYYFENKSGTLTSKSLREKIVRIIRIAIETTFSFNPLGQLSGIQIRRVNRYLIWFYQIGLIEKRITDSISLTVALTEILNILSVKPVIEISGPAMYVNKARDRILYDLSDYNRHDEELVIFKDNVIERFGKTRDFKLETLVEGFKKSNYKIIYDFISNLFWAKTK
ncbi:MAG: hypothetical protein NTW29_21610 [Bacteroidetes bacterium]|nr:hypothetical protein [Bacteroidota bacterium]